MEDNILYELAGETGTLIVYKDRIIIKRPNSFMERLVDGYSGEKTIPISSIKTVRFTEGRRVINGFITFDTLGSNESQSSNIRDQNEVAFKKKYNKLAKEIKEFIEGTLIKQAQNPQNASASYSIADEILKYKNLLDMGAITRAEYEKLKNQLLNL